MSLIEPTKTENKKLTGNYDWMFDSGASAHMTGDLTLLFETNATTPMMIDLPN